MYNGSMHLAAFSTTPTAGYIHIWKNNAFFERMLLPVDVFHFKTKHKTTHAYCQENCNPAKWSVLSDGKGGWVFNSSAAEQANAWIGRFLPIVQDMVPCHYDFFLDEMIKRHNEGIVHKLRSAEKDPGVFLRCWFDNLRNMEHTTYFL